MPLFMLKILNPNLQELGAIVALKEKRAIVKKAIRKVRFISMFENLNCCSSLRHIAFFFFVLNLKKIKVQLIYEYTSIAQFD
jgi:hypothetical protein